MTSLQGETSVRPSRIGEVAARCAVSTRTLRYYEELGLLAPSARSHGGARRYSERDEARVLRIRELQQLMGFDLAEIHAILSSEDRLAQLRAEFQAGDIAPAREEQLVREAIEINDRLRRRVKEKLARTQGFLDELEGKAKRYRAFLKDVTAGVSAGR